MKPKILSFGEIIWDVYPSEKCIGGAPLNFAAHAHLCGAESFLISAVGADALGSDALQTVRDLQIDASLIGENAFPTGKCEVTLNENGVPTYTVLENTAFDNIRLSDADFRKIRSHAFDALYFGTLIQRSAVSKATLQALCASCPFGEIICDINLRQNCYDADSATFCLTNATILKISDEEEPMLRALGLYTVTDGTHTGIAKAITAAFPNIKILILTLGEKGSFVFERASQSGFSLDGEKVKVVSTVGAGDSYTAAWCVSFLQGEGLHTATQKATARAAFVVAHKDAIC